MCVFGGLNLNVGKLDLYVLDITAKIKDKIIYYTDSSYRHSSRSTFSLELSLCFFEA